jgi:hypothetical protein
MNQSDQEAQEFIQEANEVDIMTSTKGWAIIKRDISEYIKNSNNLWMNIHPNDSRFEDLRVRTLACHMLLQMVMDYSANRQKMMDFYLKKNFPEYFIPFDVDNEYPVKEEE